ncbi:MAG: MFS transporter [Candidatus Omnitrophota bacterium]
MKKTTFIILCLEGALLSFNVAACSALIPSISQEFKTSQFIAGNIIWLYMLPYGLAALFYGPLVRVIDAKKIELVCFFLFSLANLIAALSQDLNMLFIARFFMGLFGASVIPLVLILISHYASDTNRGKLVGTFFSSTFVASLVGLFLTGFIPWRLIFLIPAILGFILWIHIYFYLPSFKEIAIGFKFNYLTLFKAKKIIFIFAYIFLISLFYHGLQQWLGVYFSVRYSFSQLSISMLITSVSLSGIFGEVLGGWFSDFVGRLKIVNLGLILMTISIFLLTAKWPIIVLALIMIVWGLGWTFNHAGISTLLTDLPKEFLNEAASLNSSIRFLSGSIGVGLGGLLMQRNFNFGFVIFGICLVCLLSLTKPLLGNN